MKERIQTVSVGGNRSEQSTDGLLGISLKTRLFTREANFSSLERQTISKKSLSFSLITDFHKYTLVGPKLYVPENCGLLSHPAPHI